MLLTTVHWFCCGWGLIAQIQGTQRTEALKAAVAADATCPGCTPSDPYPSPRCTGVCLLPCEITNLAALTGNSEAFTFANENWICRAISEGVLPPGGNYHHYRYLHVASVFGQMGAKNLGEYTYAYVIAFFWLMIQNAFIGILCGTVADGDKHAKDYKARMDELNYFLRDMSAPRDLAVRAREHCRSTRSLFKKFSYQKLFEIMSPMLRGDLAQLMSKMTLENVWYFAQCETELLRALSEKLKPIAFARGEKIWHADR